ncbi:hypothetical protein GCM10009599_19050 [Luteococcus peritonei]
MPGWYPDPAGNPGHFRYWDGASWSQQTTTDPSSAVPGSTAPAGRERKGVLGLLLGGLAALLVLSLLIWALFFREAGFTPVPEDTNSASPTGPVWNETDTPTPTPSGSTEPAPSGGSMVDCPTGGGDVVPATGDRLHGGGLSVPRIEGWDDATAMLFTLPWVQNMQAQTKVIHRAGGTSWFSVNAVGALAVADGFEDPRTSAQQMMSCFATSGYYSGFTGRKDLSSQAVTIDGHKGWWLRSEVHVEMAALPQVEGDVIDVVIVDTGDGESLGAYVNSGTIGDTEVLDALARSREAMTVG